ncbi:A disintegrin and metalloproteinase with thrombospondin motifs 6 [Ciona intestinalis]
MMSPSSFNTQVIYLILFIGASLLQMSASLSSKHIQRRQELLLRNFEELSKASSEATIHTIRPQRIDRNGGFIEFATLDPISSRSGGKLRKRRSVEATNVLDTLDAAAATADGNHEVFYDLGDAPGSPLSGAKLRLTRNYKLVSKNFVVEERSRSGKIRSRHTKLEECHYVGVIHNHNSFSKVALSLCNGMQGLITKDDDTFFIEPKWNHTSNSTSSEFSTTASPQEVEEGHPHVIVKRSAIRRLMEKTENDDELGHCGNAEVDLKSKQEKTPKEESSSSQRSHHHKKQFEDLDFESLSNHRTSAGRRRGLEEDSTDEVINEEDVVKSRGKRSISTERNVETMVVADKMMMVTHGKQELEKYILTIMNIVASFYHDASIGNAINIIITRVIILTEDQPNLEISTHAGNTLNSFCEWQAGVNINSTGDSSDSGLAHHDNAVLLTGNNICANDFAPCATLGMANVGGICENERSCNINQDTGLASAFTIAHEIGHNFDMEHDGTNNDCGPRNGEPSQIMSPQLTKYTSPFSWSSCSKKYITDYLDSGSGDCLLNTPPQRDFDFPSELPGQLHDADEQCRLQYGASSRQCKYGDVCRELWCISKLGYCVTNSMPAATGTNCSEVNRGWCYRGHCVPFGYRADSVDGQWGEWTSWGECSRTCGTGVSSSHRSCDSPAPEHGGKYCLGGRKRYRSCNTQECPNPKSDFRQEQCARFDTEPFQGRYLNWIAFDGGYQVKPCALNCKPEGYSFYAERAGAVIDGTRCFSNSLDMCINGECHHVGCDHVLHSDAVEDKCRVCGGDGSTCRTEAGVFNLPVTRTQYQEVITIPRGSVNIFIQELEISVQNYIALRNTRGDEYINGGWAIDWPRKFDIAGTTFSYKRPAGEPESLQALGPTTEDLVVMMLLQEPNRGLRYEYNVRVEREGSAGAESAFLWSHGDWTPCTASCAGGTQRRPIECRRVDDDTVVQHSYCNSDTMPSEQVQTCNAEPCPARWITGSWGQCSRSCDGGHHVRTVVCMRAITQTEDEVVDDRYCTGRKPWSTGSCGTEACPARWHTGDWSRCNPTCGAGWKTRVVTCASANGDETYDDSQCDVNQKPSVKAHCMGRACRAKWVTYKWGQCSMTCGRGTKRRRVVCIDPVTNRASNTCSRNKKPKTTVSCSSSSPSCVRSPARAPAAGRCIDDPTVAYCPLVLQFHYCNRAYFRKACCATCSKSR